MPGQNSRIQQVLQSAERYTAKITEALLEIDTTADAALAKPGISATQSAMLLGLRNELDAVKSILANVDQDGDTTDFLANLEQVAEWAKANAAMLADMTIASPSSAGFMTPAMVVKLADLKPASDLSVSSSTIPASTGAVIQAMASLTTAIEDVAANSGGGIFSSIDTGYTVDGSVSLLGVGDFDDNVPKPNYVLAEFRSIRGITYGRGNSGWHILDTDTMVMSGTLFTGFSGYNSFFGGASGIVARRSNPYSWVILDDDFNLVKVLNSDINNNFHVVEYNGNLYGYYYDRISKYDLDGNFIEVSQTYSYADTLKSPANPVIVGNTMFFTHLAKRKLATLNMDTFEADLNPYPWVVITSHTRNPGIAADNSRLLFEGKSSNSAYKTVQLDVLTSKSINATNIDLMVGPGDTVVTGSGVTATVTGALSNDLVAVDGDIALGSYTDTIRRMAEDDDVVTVVERDGEVFGVGRKPVVPEAATDISEYLLDEKVELASVAVDGGVYYPIYAANNKLTGYSTYDNVTVTCHGDATLPTLYIDGTLIGYINDFGTYDIERMVINTYLPIFYAVTTGGLVLAGGFDFANNTLAELTERPDLNGTEIFQLTPSPYLLKYTVTNDVSTIALSQNYHDPVWESQSDAAEYAVDMDVPFPIDGCASIGNGYFVVKRSASTITDGEVEPSLYLLKYIDGQRDAKILSESTLPWIIADDYGKTLDDMVLGSKNVNGRMSAILSTFKNGTIQEHEVYFNRLATARDLINLPTSTDMYNVDQRIQGINQTLTNTPSMLNSVVGTLTRTDFNEFDSITTFDPISQVADVKQDWIKNTKDGVLAKKLSANGGQICEWDEGTLTTGANATGVHVDKLHYKTTIGESGYLSLVYGNNRYHLISDDFSTIIVQFSNRQESIVQEYNGFFYGISETTMTQIGMNGFGTGLSWHRASLSDIIYVGMIGSILLHMANGNGLYAIDLASKSDSMLVTVLPDTFESAYLSKIADKIVFVKDGQTLTMANYSNVDYYNLELENLGILVTGGDLIHMGNGTTYEVARSIGPNNILVDGSANIISQYANINRVTNEGDVASVVDSDDAKYLVMRTPRSNQSKWVERILTADDEFISLDPSDDVDVYLNLYIQHQLDFTYSPSGKITSVSVPGSLIGESVLIKRYF